MDKKDNQDSKFLVLCLGALGVVFGDIGTSPLYAIKEIFAINNNISNAHQFQYAGHFVTYLLVFNFNCFH